MRVKRVRLVGIHSVRAKLADGTEAVYHYAWRGGPRMKADPTDEDAFGAEFFKLTRKRADTKIEGMFPELVRKYRASGLYTKLKQSTLKGYDAAIDRIEAEWHRLPLVAMGEPGTRRMFLEWRDGMSSTPRNADYTMAVLARMLSFGADRELITKNPLERLDKINDGTRRDMIWSDAQVLAFLKKAPPKLRLAMCLAMWTGQRQGDLLKLTWSNYDGTHLKHRQGKTGKIVRYRVYSELKVELDAEKARRDAAAKAGAKAGRVIAMTILTTTRRNATPWTSDGFRASWGAVCDDAKVEGVTFHDLRGTFITLAYRKHNASFREIAEISGHSERDVETIVRKHYLAGESVIAKLEAGNVSGSKL